jgi:hypothetical protein
MHVSMPLIIVLLKSFTVQMNIFKFTPYRPIR